MESQTRYGERQLAMRSNRTCLFTAAIGCALLLLSCVSTSDALFQRRGVLPDFRANPGSKDKLGAPKALAHFTSDEMQGSLSADGRFLVFASNQKGNLDIWIKDLATGMQEILAPHLAADQMPAISPDGKRLAFVSMRDDVKGDIYLLDLENRQEAPVRLTGRETTDQYPVFTPDGQSLLYASGTDEALHIERLTLADKKQEVLSAENATQPAVSPDGAFLAYIHKNKEGINSLVIRRLRDKKTVELPSGGLHMGFPSFSPDGASLYFAWFFHTRPGQALAGSENASVWRLPLNGIFEKTGETLTRSLTQISSSSNTHLFLQATRSGLIYTTRNGNNLDIAVEPLEGILPGALGPAELLILVGKETNLAEQMFLLNRFSRFPDSPEYREALYRLGQLYVRNGLFEQGRNAFETLSGLPETATPWQALARIDKAVWLCESTQTLSGETGLAVTPAMVAEAEKAVTDLARTENRPRVLAYALLRQGDLARMANDDQNAMAFYRELIRRHPDERDYALRAKIRIGRLYHQLGDAESQVAYYRRLLAEYPENAYYQRQIAEEIISVYRDALSQSPELSVLHFSDSDSGWPTTNSEQKRHLVEKARYTLNERLLEKLRALVETNKASTIMGSVLSLRMGDLYAEQNRYDLSIDAMRNVALLYPDNKDDTTRAIFSLGDYSLKLADDYRRSGRFAEASSIYSASLDEFENVAGLYPEGSLNRIRATRQFLSLALLKAGREEADGEILAAEKTYRRVLSFDPGNLSAWRKLIVYGLARKDDRSLGESLDQLAQSNATAFAAYYAKGYLETLKAKPSEQSLDNAEELFVRAENLDAQNPYVYLSLGWVAEMRERYLGDANSGKLEEAIELYQKAYLLNDRGTDPQLEADILLNLGNAFLLLGNTWNYAYEFYNRRCDLALPFQNRTQEALYELSFGRAAFNLEKNEEAIEHFERALSLAKASALAEVEAEVVARLALIYQLQGRYELSSQYFERSIGIFRNNAMYRSLPALTRALAFNDIVTGKRQAALSRLQESLDLLDRYGTNDIGDFARLASGIPGGSLAPRGFSRTHEKEVNASLRARILEDMRRFRLAEKALEEKKTLMSKRFEDIEDASSFSAIDDSGDEMKRELAVVESRRGAFAYSTGDIRSALASFLNAFDNEEALQSKPVSINPSILKLARSEAERSCLTSFVGVEESVIVPIPHDLNIQARLATSSAELLVQALYEGYDADLDSFDKVLKRLEAVQCRADLLQRNGENPFDPTVAWKLANAISTLGVEWAKRQSLAVSRQNNDVKASFTELATLSRRISHGLRALKTIIKETDHSEPSNSATGINPVLQTRIHLQAMLNLEELYSFANLLVSSSKFEPKRKELLDRAAQVCDSVFVPDLCPLVSMRTAMLNGNDETLAASFDLFANEPPILYDDIALGKGLNVRSHVFYLRLLSTLKNNDAASAWLVSEEENQRLFIEAISASPLGADNRDIDRLLHAVQEASSRFRLEREAQFRHSSRQTKQQTTLQLEERRTAFDTALKQLGDIAPPLRNAFVRTSTDLNALKPMLDDATLIVRIIPLNSQLVFLLFDHDGPRMEKLKLDNAYSWLQLKQRPATNETHSVYTAFMSAATSILKRYRVVYLDTSHIALDLLDDYFEKNTVRASRFGSLQSLIQAYENRTIAGEAPRLFLDPSRRRQNTEPALSDLRQSGSAIVDTKTLQTAEILDALEKAPNAYLDAPLVFEGQAKTNWWFDFGPSSGTEKSISLLDHMDLQLNSAWAWIHLDDLHSVPRETWICLERLLFNTGISALIVSPESQDSDLDALHRFTAKTGTESPRDSMQGSAPKHRFVGFVGLDAVQAKEFAKGAILPTIQKAIQFQQKRSTWQAINAYENALSFIQSSGEEKFLDKVLEMLVDQTFAAGYYKRSIDVQKQVLLREEKKLGADPAQVQGVIKAKTILARNYAKAGHIETALNVNNEVGELCKASGSRLCQAETYAQRGFILENEARYSEALASYESSYGIFKDEKQHEGQLQQARNAARVLRLRLSDYKKADEYLQSVLPLAMENKKDRTLYMQLRLELARNAFSLGRYSSTLDISRDLVGGTEKELAACRLEIRNLKENTAIKENEKNSQLAVLNARLNSLNSLNVQARIEIVNTLWQQENFVTAIGEQEAAMKLAMEMGDTTKQIILNNARALIYSSMGEMDKAIETLNGTLTLATEINDKSEQASAYNNLGDTLRKAGRLGEAKNAILRAMEIDSQQNFKLGLAYDFANLALVYETMGRNDEAIENAQRALVISKELGSPVNEIKASLTLGRIHLGSGDPVKADIYLRSGLECVLKYGLHEWKWKFELHLGRLFAKKGDSKRALQAFMNGIEDIEPLPAIKKGRTGLRGLDEEKRDLYDEAIEVLAQSGKSEDAFLLSERYRARSFLDFVAATTIHLSDPKAEKAFYEALETKRILRETGDGATSSTPSGQTASPGFYEAAAGYHASLAKLSEYKKDLVSYVGVDVTQAGELVKHLPADTALLSYHVTHSSVIVWLLSGDAVFMKRIPITRAELTKKIETFRETLIHYGYTDDVSRELYARLLKPFEKALDPKRRLVLVPADCLHFVPFSALMMDDGSGRYLGQKFELHYLSSAGQLRYLDQSALGPFDVRVAVGPGKENEDWPALPFTRQEIRSMNRSFPGTTLLLDAKATETEVKRLARNSDLVHFAGHSELNRNAPYESYLRLRISGSDDGKWRFSEILGLGLQAQLVVLSSCESGIGPVEDGDAVVGLSRAFLTAGAKRVMASQWRVSDLATALLMKHFYRKLTSVPPGEALKLAQEEVRKLFPHPAYWAGFRLEGSLD